MTLGLLALLACVDGAAPVDSSPSARVLFLDERAPPNLRVAEHVSEDEDIPLFTAPSGSFLYEFDARPEDGRLVITYTEPAAEGEEGYDRSALFEVVDGEARRLACEDARGLWCFYPQWTPDGERVWFIQQDRRKDPDAPPVLAWADAASGELRAVQRWATEPAVGPDGQVAWVGLDPETGARSLELGDADGRHLRTLVAAGDVYDLGQPVFSADGEAVWFVALAAPTAAWWPPLISVAQAHDNHLVAGDWWSVPVGGGALEQLSFTGLVHYDGAATPDGQLLTVTELGLARLQPGSTEALFLRTSRSLRAVDWAY